MEAHDLSKVPSFESLATWIGKLEGWCQAASKKHVEAVEELQVTRDELSDAEATIEELPDKLSWSGLLEYVEDVKRGIRTSQELFDYIEREGYRP